MATTAIIPLHINKGKTAGKCIKERLDYIMNPGKTQGGTLLSSHACAPETAANEFMLLRNAYLANTGRTILGEIIGYHVRQSFKPGEITPELANKIGYELAARLTNGEHAYVVATHTDRRHIHNHIFICSYALDGNYKYKNVIRSNEEVFRISDELCREYGLSVVQNPQNKTVSYDKWQGNQKPIASRDFLRMAIDAALRLQPDGFDALMQLLEEIGCRIKRGAHISILPPDGKRYIRLDSLQEKERADSQASLNMLEDILKRYPYNWNNDNFRRNFHAKALDIKHDADAKLILYQKQIAEKIKGLPAVYLDAAVQDAMKQLQKLFHDYSMALYLFSFASYLEVMLDGRFVAEDLKIVADKVHDYQENYDRQFEQCRDYVKKFSGGSVEMMVAGGIANAAKGLGKLIGSAPILKDGPVDEWLQNCGEQIEKANEEKVAKLAESFAAEQKTGSEIFESSIRNVDELSNQVKGMLFDEEYLYLVA